MIRQDWSTLKKLMFMKAAAGGSVIEDTATGNPLTFNTNVAKPLRSLLIPFTPVQSGTGDPSPENVRPIAGLTGLTAWRTGKNLVQFPYAEGETKVTHGITFTVLSDGGISISGESNDVCYYNMVESTKKVLLKAGTYSKKLPPDSNVQFNIYKNDTGTAQQVSAGNNKKFTLSEDTYVYYYLRVANGVNFATPVVVYPQIEVGEESTDYETPTGESFPVDWTDEAGTVYGGILDVVSGILSVTHIGKTFIWSEGTNETDIGEGYKRRRFLIGNFNVVTGTANNISDKAKYGSLQTAQNAHFNTANFSGGDSYAYIYLPNNTPDTETITVCSMLETPQEIQLTPEQITALVGDNTIWSDANGDIEVTFLKKA